jgi:hypothetical protein
LKIIPSFQEMSRFDYSETPKTALVLAALAFTLSLILRQLPILSWLLYPFQLLVTLVHELSHGLAALLTGGEFLRFTMATNTSGLAVTAGGWRGLVVSAGYLGPAFFGGLLLVLTNRSSQQRQRQWLALTLGLFFTTMTLLFARNVTAIIVGGATSTALLILARYGSAFWSAFCLNLVAIQCGLDALDSLIGLVHLEAGPFQSPNDAQTMADLTHVPAFIWALLWSLLALAILIGSGYLSIRRGSPT